MWKVKRMNTACIVVLTIAIGAGGIAAYLASGSAHPFAAPAAPIAQIQPATTASNNFISPRGEGVNTVPYGVASRQVMQT